MKGCKHVDNLRLKIIGTLQDVCASIAKRFVIVYAIVTVRMIKPLERL